MQIMKEQHREEIKNKFNWMTIGTRTKSEKDEA